MPHFAILGQTYMGKSNLGKILCAGFRANKTPTLVLKKEGEDWPADWQTSDKEKFLRKFWRSRGCAVFVELSDADVLKKDPRFHRLLTKGRHNSHRVHVIMQRHTQADPIVRENVIGLYVFVIGPKAAREWAEEFADEALLRAPALPPYRFLLKIRGQPTRGAAATGNPPQIGLSVAVWKK